MLAILSAVLELLGTPKLTTDQVWVYVPREWTPTTYGEKSLLVILQQEYDLPPNTPDTATLHHLLSQLRDEGHIEYESRLIDDFHHSHCRLVNRPRTET